MPASRRFRRSAWRTFIRGRTPDWLFDRGFVVDKVADCRDHEWYSHRGGVDHCYHCRMERRTPPDAPWFDLRHASTALRLDPEEP